MHPVENRTARSTIQEIEIDEDLEFQRRYWRVQRIGWVLLALFLMAAAIGLFGGGMVSRTTARGHGLTIEYSRFARENAPMLIVVRVPASVAQAGQIQLSFNADYIAKLSFQRITPQPQAVEAAAGRVTFQFLANAQPGDLTFSFEAKPREFGRASVQVMMEGSSGVGFWQLVYP
jgi:hypothetical protein